MPKDLKGAKYPAQAPTSLVKETTTEIVIVMVPFISAVSHLIIL